MNTTKHLEIFAFIIFCVLTIFLSFFHEPWFDEMQAWAISKDTIYNILFFAPHYEGHPPLWHLILKLFSFFKVNVEIGIRIPNLFFMFMSVYLLLFKSPFHKIYKILLVFTYFIFYQYTIINRPYSIFCFALFLGAVLYKNRNLAPFKYTLSLILLCFSCVYGMVIATGLIIVWFIEIIKDYKQTQKKFITFFKDRRFIAFSLLFIVNLFLTLIMIPEKNTVILNNQFAINYFLRSIYSLFGLTADASLYNLYNYKTNFIFSLDLYNLFIKYSVPVTNYLVLSFKKCCILGILLNIILILYFKKTKTLLLFVIPYAMLIMLFSLLYFYPHHIGLVFIFFIFAVWCSIEENNYNSQDLIIKIFNAVAFICICVQITWSSSSFYYEIFNNYGLSRELVAFIKNNNLQNRKIMSNWFETNPIHLNKNNNRIAVSKINNSNENYYISQLTNLNEKATAIIVNPYFNKNIFYNFNVNNPDKQYIILRKYSEEENKAEEKWLREQDLPDVVIGKFDNKRIFGDKFDLKKYAYKQVEAGYVFKNVYLYFYDEIYVKKDLLNKKDLY